VDFPPDFPYKVEKKNSCKIRSPSYGFFGKKNWIFGATNSAKQGHLWDFWGNKQRNTRVPIELLGQKQRKTLGRLLDFWGKNSEKQGRLYWIFGAKKSAK